METPTTPITPLPRAKYISPQIPYHFMFVKITLLFVIAMYMALRGFLSYTFIKQEVGTNVEEKSKEYMIRFLSLLSILFLIAECTLFFGFIAISKENIRMTTIFASLLTLQIVTNVILREPTAVLFSVIIASFSWWFRAMLKTIIGIINPIEM
ncbi:hypothetical protein HDE_01537 [Halotydeus destructor]|nr:hypothetical protein HDE_01537 [Halotydeus destructor]